ncbi:MAG: hypothetical protein ACYC8V_09290 [Caulobacteraceae bacterium]
MVASPSPPARGAIALAPRHWLTREIGECAFPIDEPEIGDDWRARSCCNPCGSARYCPAHLAVVRGDPANSTPCEPAPTAGNG